MSAGSHIPALVERLILADRVMQRQGLIWGEQYEELSKPIRAARKELDAALEANAQALASKEAELMRLRADILPLQEFADAVFGEFPDHGDIDGFDLQDIAEACGLLKKESTVVPCGETCQCAETGAPDGAASECYRVQPVMRRARIASARHNALTQQPKEPT